MLKIVILLIIINSVISLYINSLNNNYVLIQNNKIRFNNIDKHFIKKKNYCKYKIVCKNIKTKIVSYSKKMNILDAKFLLNKYIKTSFYYNTHIFWIQNINGDYYKLSK